LKHQELTAKASRRDFIGRTFAIIGAATATQAAAQKGPEPEAAATHNMMVVGQKTMFLSHLPMFDHVNKDKTAYLTPHRFQVILEASLSAPSRNPNQVYFEDRRSHPMVRMYTLKPEPFVLATLFPTDSKTAPRRSFPVVGLFRGHLERAGNARIVSGGTVTVQRVLHSHQFAVSDKRPDSLEYIVFGKGDELFAAHFIAAPPEFDQILPIRIIGRTFTADELNQGIRLSIPDRKNIATARLNKQASLPAKATVGRNPSMQVMVEAATELYFEEGELLIPPKFEQTAEEKKSGFTEEMI